ncbi:GSCOCG00011564001-RA-CDS [Cotesia congregata]|nr:GSCOCG00011564001-RA-CDS [Cotesia congregata]
MEPVNKMKVPKTTRKITASKRITIKPTVPEKLKEFKNLVTAYQLIKSTFIAQVEADDGSCASILSTKYCFDLLGKAEEIYLHATYKIQLSDIKISQILIFFVRRNNIGIPCVFVLSDSTIKSLYAKIWENLILRIPSIKENLKRVVTDCYLPLTFAILEALPQTDVKGCWMNYIRMAARQWKSCNLVNMRHEVLKWSFLIPSLPPDQFKNAIMEINETIRDKKETYIEPVTEKFMSFIKRWWEPAATIISFSNSTNDSINISEYFDRHMGSEFGSLTPDIFQFSECIKRICDNSENTWKMMERGAQFELYEKQSFIKINNHISNNLELLSDGKISLEEYFKQAMTSDIHELILKILETRQCK